jgi:AcrR family transcriptional regulator
VSTAPQPGEDQVRAAAEELLAAYREGGAYPTVTALAKRFGINRTTVYRHFAPAAEAMLDAAQQQHTDERKRRRPVPPDDERDRALWRLRNENDDLRKHVEIYEEHLRMLTTENARPRHRLQCQAEVIDLAGRHQSR